MNHEATRHRGNKRTNTCFKSCSQPLSSIWDEGIFHRVKTRARLIKSLRVAHSHSMLRARYTRRSIDRNVSLKPILKTHVELKKKNLTIIHKNHTRVNYPLIYWNTYIFSSLFSLCPEKNVSSSLNYKNQLKYSRASQCLWKRWSILKLIRVRSAETLWNFEGKLRKNYKKWNYREKTFKVLESLFKKKLRCQFH